MILQQLLARISVFSCFMGIFFFTSCSPSEKSTAEIWFKGNTHAHTTICGHADTEPDSVALWYLNHGYNFLILSEHNHFINPDSVHLPSPRREDFILIAGEEVTGKKHVHTTALNIQSLVEEPTLKDLGQIADPQERLRQGIAELRKPSLETKTQIMQRHTDDILRAGGVPILNHPNFGSGVRASDMMPVQRLHMFELYNGHPHVYNWGTDQHAPVEAKWDSLLSAGKLVLGVSSDDAHHFKEWTDDTSNPGRGWVMVNSDGVLTPEAITAAMSKGHFYATNGVILASISSSKESMKVAIDSLKTAEEVKSPYVTGKKNSAGKPGFKIEFIGLFGKSLASFDGTIAEYKIQEADIYVRAKLTYTRSSKEGVEHFYAWTQPQFLDERDRLLKEGQVNGYLQKGSLVD